MKGTGVQRQSGSVFLQGDFVLGVAAGTNVTNPAEVTGSVFGTPLVDPTGDIRILHERHHHPHAPVADWDAARARPRRPRSAARANNG